MLTMEEAEYLRRLVSEYEQNDGLRIEMIRAINRATDTYAPNQGTDVIAKAPLNMSTRQMLDEAARALGWRTDWACGDSPVTWELVIEAIRKHVRSVPPDPVAACVGDSYRFNDAYKKEPTTLEVIRVQGYRDNDLVFFEDGTHSTQRHLRKFTKVK